MTDQLQSITTAPTDGTIIFTPTDLGYPVPIAWMHYSKYVKKERSFWKAFIGYPADFEYIKMGKSWCIVCERGVLATNIHPTTWYPNPQKEIND